MIATNTELLKKYDIPGPRYTSYPTILYWDTTPTLERWLESVEQNLAQASEDGTGAAIYVHVPFCRSLCTYCGCNSRITQNATVGAPYVRTVLRELSLYREGLNLTGRLPLTELHLGGGTPTFLTPAELETLIGGILGYAQPTPAAEFSIESDPRVTTREHLAVLQRLGFNRLSLGIQDFDPVVQAAVNRVQTEAQVRLVTEQAREIGFDGINYDLIYGLPFQTQNSIRQTMQIVKRLRPDRIAFYAYAHVPWVKPGQRHFTEVDLPVGDEKRAMYEYGRELLEDAGYREIGMDHFALPEDSLWQAALDDSLHRNFMGYTSRFVSPLIGLGTSAISDSWDVFVQNEKDVDLYEERVWRGEFPIFRGHDLTSEDKVLRRHILNLMTRFETQWREPEVHVPFLDSVGERLAEPSADGLVRLSPDSCRVTEEGRPFLRNVCMAFDARLARKAPTTQLFSRTI
jgi:oxygen-independent coproporphyrinogen III oxidase